MITAFDFIKELNNNSILRLPRKRKKLFKKALPCDYAQSKAKWLMKIEAAQGDLKRRLQLSFAELL